ncbi:MULTISPECIES: universal stress protein [unclassified Rhodococcus (in: high G+C Gram-positive bacteria)]|uniref:universal stress protein n=1 Tax=unclassified Rhodococcus (in: high G+C Gram-positive bacteria) TaxID=192944 RepID=UPI0005C2299E|nr:MULTISPECIES: universal stress protein [unclassified Rhodococcus (in: high G+C Gram-positive bacteria)]MBC2637485.1 universal stress protein [Rhodococcus sp. 3A]MBC2898215.1 universal stress protein [Rhodococcus sp. 4CII]
MIKKKPPDREGVRDWRKPVRVDGPAAATEPVCHLVVGFDRYPASHQALSFAMGLAVPLHAYLHVAHVVDLDDFPVEPDRDDWERRIVETVERERTEACTMLAALPGNWSYYSHEGNPAHLLATIADANDALMIIIGSARGGLVSVLERALGESVSSHLVHHGRRPVVLVPETRVDAAPPAAGP